MICFRSIFRSLLVIVPLLGFTFVVGFFIDLHPAMGYVFVILNGNLVSRLTLFKSFLPA